jgi:hypothetical protein
MVSPETQKLPTDVLLYILSEHFEGDQGTLRAVSLLCRNIRPFAQRSLFRSTTVVITVGQHCQSRKILKSLAILLSAPFFSIKHLSLISHAVHCSKEDAVAWCHNLQSLFERVVRKFISEGSIEKLSMTSLFGHNVLLKHFTIRALLQQLCHCPSIQSLELTDLPGAFLCLPFPTSLKHLTSRNMYEFEIDNIPRSPNQVALESLCIYPQYYRPGPGGGAQGNQEPMQFLATAGSYISLKRLKHISAQCKSLAHESQLAIMLRECKHSLRSLDLKLTGKSSGSALPRTSHSFFRQA